MFKRIISCICFLAIIFSFFLPSSFAYASGLEDLSDVFDITDLWSFLMKMNKSVPFSEAIGIIAANGSYPGCSSSPDGSHHFIQDADPFSPISGYRLHCQYCYTLYADYIDGAYHDALADNDLSGMGVDSEGGLIWYPTVDDLDNPRFTTNSGNRFSFTLSGSNINIYYDNLDNSAGGDQFYRFSCNLICPFDGYYSSLPFVSTFSAEVRPGTTGLPLSGSNSYKSGYFKGNNTSGSSLLFYQEGRFSYKHTYAHVILPLPAFSFTPQSSDFPSQQFFTVINNINTSNFNIAIVDEHEEITEIYQDITIISNDNTTFTLPGGDSFPIKSWSFDFDNNEYTLIVLDGDLEIPVTVKFGIDGITIKFGDDVYEYKYVIEQPSDPDPTPIPSPSSSPDPSIPTPTPSGRPDWWPEDYDTDDTPMWDRLFQWLNDFKTWLGDKLDQLLNKEPVIQLEPDIEISLPSADPGFVYADEDGQQEIWHPSSLKQKFAFWTDVRDIGTELYTSVQAGGDAPELIVHLGAANSPFGFQYGGDEYAMDLSWYGQYKPTVDSITGGFLWLLYLYGIFKHLPEILSGVGMLDNRVEDIQSGTKGRRRGS